MEPRAPLTLRAPDDHLIHCSRPPYPGAPRQIQVRDFCRHVHALAAALPEQRYCINLCENRYWFMVSFCAVIVRGQCNLLPQNRAEGTQAWLLETYPDSYLLSDHGLESAAAEVFRADRANTHSESTQIPDIPLDQQVALAFTSGSTGQPSPNLKTWRTFFESTRINATHMLDTTGEQHYALATVPPQHMWGLETSVLMPLQARLCVSDEKPLFPQDIARRLAALPAPRLLISTPVHLRALVRSGLSFPKTERILCATAPLDEALAAEVERVFEGTLVEVFGCSEVGSMARRETARETLWTRFDGIDFSSNTQDDGTRQWQASAAHLPAAQVLQDAIELHGEHQFRLTGRATDMIEIAGKRGSLSALNQLLMQVPGVIDGAIFMPEKHTGTTRPVALFELEPDCSKDAVLAALARHLDPVFLPRPCIVVDAMPREDNGKLRHARLLEALAQHRQRSTEH